MGVCCPGRKWKQSASAVREHTSRHVGDGGKGADYPDTVRSNQANHRRQDFLRLEVRDDVFPASSVWRRSPLHWGVALWRWETETLDMAQPPIRT